MNARIEVDLRNRKVNPTDDWEKTKEWNKTIIKKMDIAEIQKTDGTFLDDLLMLQVRPTKQNSFTNCNYST